MRIALPTQYPRNYRYCEYLLDKEGFVLPHDKLKAFCSNIAPSEYIFLKLAEIRNMFIYYCKFCNRRSDL